MTMLEELTMADVANDPAKVQEAIRAEVDGDFAARKGANYSPTAPGARLDGRGASLGKLIRVVLGRETSPEFKKALGETVGAEGGFLVPEQLRAQLEAVVLNEAIIRPRALVLPMTFPALSIPTLSPSSSASNFFGGVTAHWAAEGDDMSLNASQPALSQTRLDAKKLYCYAKASAELVADVPAFDAFARAAFGGAIAYTEDEAFLVGTGAGQPLGILNAPATITQAKEGGQAANTVVWENITAMVSRMLPASLRRAIWIVSPSVFDELLAMSLAVGTGGAPAPLNLAGPTPSMVWRPLFVADALPALGSAGDLMFVDPAYYVIGDRQELRIDASIHPAFTADQVHFRITERLDGRPWISNELTPRNGTDAVSPFVTLAERS